MMPPELRREGWKGRCVAGLFCAGDVGGRRKKKRNAMVRMAERTVVTALLCLDFVFMIFLQWKGVMLRVIRIA